MASANEILKDSESWKAGKTYTKYKVKAFSHPKGPLDGAPWHARVSVHTTEDATFDEFWAGLGQVTKDKAKIEAESV